MAVESLAPRIVGDEPGIVGSTCNGLVVMQAYEGLALSDQATAVFLRFDGIWYQICFEAGTVFWRYDCDPKAPVNSSLAYGLLLNNLSEVDGIVGGDLDEIHYTGSESGDVQVRFVFRGGAQLRLSYDSEADATRVMT